MTRLPRFLPSVVLACCSVALPLFPSQSAWAQETRASVAAEPAYKANVEGFWHYAKIFRYDLASAEAKKILDAKPEPGELLQTFEQVAKDRNDTVDQWMLRWQQIPELRESVDPLLAILREGYALRRADQSIIEENIKRLPTSDQAYAIAIGHLRESGEIAVPLMLKYLRDPAQAQFHPFIRRALVDMGQKVISPLTASLDAPMNDANQAMILTVISALSEIGYDVAVPPLAAMAQDKSMPGSVKSAARDALVRMGAGDPANMNPAQLYYQIAERYYYGKTAASANPAVAVTYFWTWDDQRGLAKVDVPTPIYGDLMAMRNARRSLQLDSSSEQALSLWLAANYGREVQLPPGATDPTRSEQTPSAHYYGVASGAKYLNAVVHRAINDRNTGVALAAVRSLQKIGGESNIFAAGQSDALVAAMQYPDRLVRFEAAFAAAAALPQSSFVEKERVVPILAEALSQTGQPHVVVVASEKDRNARVQQLRDAGYVVAGVANAQEAVAAPLPAIDAVIITDENPDDATRMIELASSTPRLQGAAVLVLTKTEASPFAVVAAKDVQVSVSPAGDAAAIVNALNSARARVGATPMDAETASKYALRSAELLRELAISRGQVLDLRPAEATLLQSLDDSRAEIVLAAGRVLALIKSTDAQLGLLTKASDPKTDAQVKVGMFNSLATNARFFGNLLPPDQVKVLQKAVAAESDLAIRSAAAEAHGALNLPADEVRSLLVK